MKFATIMRGAGVNIEFWPKCAEIEIVLYDDNEVINETDDIIFSQGIFDNNIESFSSFVDLVDSLNENPKYESINIKITESHVIIFYKTPNVIILPRNLPIEDFDD